MANHGKWVEDWGKQLISSIRVEEWLNNMSIQTTKIGQSDPYKQDMVIPSKSIMLEVITGPSNTVRQSDIDNFEKYTDNYPDYTKFMLISPYLKIVPNEFDEQTDGCYKRVVKGKVIFYVGAIDLPLVEKEFKKYIDELRYGWAVLKDMLIYQ